MPQDNRSVNETVNNPGPFLAKVISNIDPKFMGTLQVQLLRDVGNTPGGAGSTIQVKYLSPFYGVTGVDHTGKNDSYNDTQKSYGMWMVPPDVGSLVLVVFAQGDTRLGFWIGCVPDEYMNFMVPGLAATELNTEGGGKKVVAEYNKRTATAAQPDVTKNKKPVHPFQKVLEGQGLAKDETRGITTSSSRRETPSNVFGISTPGPVDRRSGAPKGTVGKNEKKVTGAFVSRLGGTTFVMDDGDENFLRKTPASKGPPEYVSVENGEKGGQPDIPHNELVRIRTRTGHQILLHNSEDLIYIANARGTAWIELTSNGKIDIWAADSISMHTAGDFNVTADNNINLTAKNNINLYAGIDINEEAGNNWNVLANSNGKLTAVNALDLKSGGGGSRIETGGGMDLKGSGPIKLTAEGAFSIKSPAIKMTADKISQNSSASADAASEATAAPNGFIAPRVPMAEPWAGHENLYGKGLTSIMDTFKKIGK